MYAGLDTDQKTSRDAFLNGKFEVLQPKKGGHRSGLDAILLASALPINVSGHAADLGSGSGVAGLAAITLRPQLSVQLVEQNPQMAQLAFQSSKLSSNGRLAKRVNVLEADVTLTGLKREKAGLLPDSFDYVMMNPPYNDTSTNRVSTDKLRAEAHMMGVGGLDAWMRTATTILKPRGMLVMIYRAQSIGQIIAATQGRLGGLTIMPIYSRADEAAKLLLIRAVKGSRAPLAIVPPLIVHNANGSFTQKAKAILDGEDFAFELSSPESEH